MASYDADIQAAVDATSVAKDGGETDLVTRLRDELAQREIETSDEQWLRETAAAIEADPNLMVETSPSDYEPGEPGEAGEQTD